MVRSRSQPEQGHECRKASTYVKAFRPLVVLLRNQNPKSANKPFSSLLRPVVPGSRCKGVVPPKGGLLRFCERTLKSVNVYCIAWPANSFEPWTNVGSQVG